LCLGLKNKILADVSWQKQTSHSEIVTQALEQLVDQAQVHIKDIKLLICSQGPGSFTGLRVGLSVVRSLAYSYQIPIIALNDCLCMAINSPVISATHQLVVLDAQKNKIFAGTYLQDQNSIRETLSPQLLFPQDLLPSLPEKVYQLTGEGLTFFPLFNETIQNKIDKTSISDTSPDAKTMFEYVQKNESQFKKQTWSELMPLYIRASAAEEVAAEKQGKKS
jgi:tRNA threonylcarbamoyladenosine biosynthesis protein TsaB